MRYPANETAEKHERILTEAARLFRERGFGGVSVADIMKAAGLTHGAFYAHFDSKEALAGESTACAMARSDARLGALMDGAADPKRIFLDAYLSADHRDRPGDGCAMAALGVEVAREPAARPAFTARLKQMIARAASRYTWKSKAPARQNAIHLISAAVGALVLARAVDDPKLSDEILASVRKSLASM